VKFPTTVQDIDELIDVLRTLDPEDKLYLATEMLSCNEDDTDNTGQIVLYTGLMWDKDGEVRKMKEEDFEEDEDELDL
jgi:hypothetical protein